MYDPVTEAEWQTAVDAAYVMLAIDSARQYGLIEGGLDIDVRRCETILSRGARRRPPVTPQADAIERLLA